LSGGGHTPAFELVPVPAGRRGDICGHRNILVSGLALFTVVSLACGLAMSGVWLLCARLAQGLAGGPLTPPGGRVIQQLFTDRGTWHRRWLLCRDDRGNDRGGPVGRRLLAHGAGPPRGGAGRFCRRFRWG
jgi:hypothetical protein